MAYPPGPRGQWPVPSILIARSFLREIGFLLICLLERIAGSMAETADCIMAGKGRALDNVFVERLWRTVKQEEVYWKGYRKIPECRGGLSAYFERYNKLREHQFLDYHYPAEVYFGYCQLNENWTLNRPFTWR